MAETLDVLTLPLHGSRLIEASAGTGKTWTIAALVLRLVLGHAPEGAAHARPPLSPTQILVVTFTRAATRELVDRIRRRLLEAAAVFRGDVSAPADDALMAGLLQACPVGPAREAALQRLTQAADAMDEAAVYTLDGWCQRILREGLDPDQAPFIGEVMPDSLALRLAAARDVWRTELQPLSGAAWQLAAALWPSPETLADDTLRAEEAQWPPLPRTRLRDAVQAVADERVSACEAVRSAWARHLPELRAWFETLWAHPGKPARPHARHVLGWLDTLAGWLEGPMDTPPLSDAARRALWPDGAAALMPAEWADRPLPPALHAVPALVALGGDSWALAQAQLRAQAVQSVRARLDTLKQQRNQLSHTDVQRRVAEALDPARGPAAAVLQERLLQRWPVALVDEFQDTSPRQLAILERTWGLGEARHPAGHLLLLIGDPKQSIYAFRGADIHSFLRARRATWGRHHTLGTNFRSSQALVTVVNRMFADAQAREPEGAFRLGRASDDPAALPFEPVAARGLSSSLMLGGQVAPALQMAVDAEDVATGDSRWRLAQRCAHTLVGWLNDAASGFTDTLAAERPVQRLRPQDVAVLVRTHAEAALVLQALAQRGVPCTFLSQKASVLITPEAVGLLHWLRAAAQPQDIGLVKAAMACELTGLSTEALLLLADDDGELARTAQLWRELAAAWQGQGVLTMVRQALHRLGVAQRWMALPEGERRLTNILHLAELLQEASRSRQREGAGNRAASLLRWYQQALQAAQDGEDDSDAPEDRVLRLERDEQAVRVITLHQSKGLEFPVVMLPFVAHVRTLRGEAASPWWVQTHDADGRAQTVLAPDDAILAQQQQAADREDLRLLYVALTRARHHLWLGVSLHRAGRSPQRVWPRTALAWLLTGPQDLPAPAVAEAIEAWAAQVPSTACTDITPLPAPPWPRWQPIEPLRPLRPLERYRADFERDWSISSYSRWVQGALDNWVPDTLREDEVVAAVSIDRPDLSKTTDTPLATQTTEATDTETAAPWHRFPRGALAGHFLHSQLEWLGERGFALADNPGLQDALRRRCEQQAFARHAPLAQAWLARLCQTPLPALGVPLSGLDSVLTEMEFWLPLQAIDTGWLDRQCQAHLLPGEPRPPLEFRAVKGLLMGFADLAFVHRGQVWVLDYKSNALGDDDRAYHPQALARAVLEHRYDVQAALYALALHRLMRTRTAESSPPAPSLGGALFWFMRGVASPGAGCLHLAVPLALLEAMDQHLLAAPSASGS